MANNGLQTRPRAVLAPPAKLPFGAIFSRKNLRHLCTRAEFLRVQGGGRRFRGQHLALLVAPAPSPVAEGSRLGLTVSRKVGNAVVRNRVRRLLRECWRLGPQGPVPAMDHVIIAFPQASGLSFAAAREELACLLVKAHGWVHAQKPATRPWPCTG